MGEYVRYAHTLVAAVAESITDVGSLVTLGPVFFQILDPDFCVNAFFALDHLVVEKCPHFWIAWFGILLLFSHFPFSFFFNNFPAFFLFQQLSMSILHVVHKIVKMDESVPCFHQGAECAIVLVIIFAIFYVMICAIFVRVVDIGKVSLHRGGGYNHLTLRADERDCCGASRHPCWSSHRSFQVDRMVRAHVVKHRPGLIVVNDT